MTPLRPRTSLRGNSGTPGTSNRYALIAPMIEVEPDSDEEPTYTRTILSRLNRTARRDDNPPPTVMDFRMTRRQAKKARRQQRLREIEEGNADRKSVDWSSDSSREFLDIPPMIVEGQQPRKKVLVHMKWVPKKDREPTIRNHVCCVADREDFLTHLAEALLSVGAPPHRIGSILRRAAAILETEMELFLFNGAVFVSFSSHTTELRNFSPTHLKGIADVQAIFREVIHDRMGANQGSIELTKLVKAVEPLPFYIKVCCAFACSLAIGPIAFGSSFIDMWFGAAASALLVWSQKAYSDRDPDGAGMFRIFIIIAVSLCARGLATVPGGYFCYDAISSTGVVMILPGFPMLTAVLELMTGTTIVGAVRMIEAIWATLTLSFSLTIGSNVLISLIPASKRAFIRVLSNRFPPKVTLEGVCQIGQSVPIPRGGNSTVNLLLTYSNSSNTPLDPPNIVAGCLREPDWPWYHRSTPWWSLIAFVPMFSICISLAHSQKIWTKNMLIMVSISCVSYIVNTVVTRFIFKHGDLASIAGAFVVGVSAHVYSRMWKGNAFCVSLTGILFLVPSGLSDSGGLASYSDSVNGYLMNSLVSGLRMIKVTTLLALGLQLATWVVYLFGKDKRGTFFSF